MTAYAVQITDANFDKLVTKSPLPVLVDFWAPWCGPCVAIAPMIEAMAQEFQGKLTIGKMNVDENLDIPASFGVRSMPFLALFKDGKVIDSIVGAPAKDKLLVMIKKAI